MTAPETTTRYQVQVMRGGSWQPRTPDHETIAVAVEYLDYFASIVPGVEQRILELTTTTVARVIERGTTEST